jgi:hypothetical protein
MPCSDMVDDDRGVQSTATPPVSHQDGPNDEPAVPPLHGSQTLPHARHCRANRLAVDGLGRVRPRIMNGARLIVETQTNKGLRD